MARLELAPNIPVQIEVKYCDLVKGQYGAQIRLKGRSNGDDVIFYADHEDSVRDLVACGAVVDFAYNPDEIPEKGLQVTLQKRVMTLCKEQAAGEKKARVRITTNGSAPVAVPAPQPTTAIPKMRGLAGPDEVAASTALAPGKVEDALTPNAEPPKAKGLGKVWLECLDFVLANVPDRLLKADIPLDGTAISAMTAQLFIARTGGK